MSNNPFADDPSSPYKPPSAGLAQPLPPGSVKTYLPESIILLLCCGGVWAIPAIVFAAQVSGKLSAGDYQGALKASQSAKTWCLVALIIGIVCQGIGGLFYIMMIAGAAAGGGM